MNDQLTNNRLVPKSVITIYAKGNYHKDYYLESREMLGGWVIEASFPRAGRPVTGPINDFSIDFAEQKADLG